MVRYKVRSKRFRDRVELPRDIVIIRFERHESLDSKGEPKVEYEVVYLEPER